MQFALVLMLSVAATVSAAALASNLAVGGYMGVLSDAAGIPQIYNIEADPKERVNFAHAGAGWVMVPYLQTIGEYLATLEQFPNPPAPNLTDFR